jgi:hypothetical protein
MCKVAQVSFQSAKGKAGHACAVSAGFSDGMSFSGSKSWKARQRAAS